MREPLLITSLQNPKIKSAKALWDRRDRDKTSTFLIEGYRELTRAHASKQPLTTLFFCPELFLGENENTLIEKIVEAGATPFRCAENIFKSLSYRDRPDGLLAVAPKHPKHLSDLTFKKDPFLMIAEAIEKPGNLGTILRSSDAAGCDGVIIADPCTDIYNPNVVRASVGTLFALPVIQEEGREVLSYLKKNKIKIVAATPEAKQEFTRADLTGPIAIVVGTEQIGLTEAWKKEADIKVSIPMRGIADSLNVAVATTLLLYEVQRQRDLSR